MKALALLSFVLQLTFVSAQKRELNLVAGYGLSYFFTDRSVGHQLDQTQLLGLNVAYGGDKQTMVFNPGFFFGSNHYHAQLLYNGRMHVNQHIFGLTLDVLTRLKRNLFIRVGLLVANLNNTNMYLTYRSGSYYTSIGTSDLSKGYSGASLQAAVRVGLSAKFITGRHSWKTSFTICHYASPIVTRDFIASKSVALNNAKILTVKGRPTMLIMAIEFNLLKLPKQIKTDLLDPEPEQE